MHALYIQDINTSLYYIMGRIISSNKNKVHSTTALNIILYSTDLEQHNVHACLTIVDNTSAG